MTEIILGVALIVAIGALVLVVRMENQRLRDELTANRLERDDLLQRIQAPQLAAAKPYLAAPAPPSVDDSESDEAIENDWASSDASLIEYDPDLAFEDDALTP